MRKRVLTAALLLVFSCGCSHVYLVDPTAGGESLARLNEGVRGKAVTIELRNGTELVGDGVVVGADTTLWYDLEAITEHTAIATSDIARISFRQRLATAGRYGKLGLAGGSLAGLLTGVYLASSYSGVHMLPGVLVGGGAGALLGGGAALLAGFVFAPEEVYEFSD